MCGGTFLLTYHTACSCGLSPRVRGNPLSTARRLPPRGSIPACAGEPTWTTRVTWPAGVYPRVCGGTRLYSHLYEKAGGLSPRVRGNRGPPGHRYGGNRSIPACAGEPTRLNGLKHQRPVYPRVCGGTFVSACNPAPMYGLSPRVRGNPVSAGCHRHSGRSIPACAGEPARRAHPRPALWVYPRVCGGTGSSLAARSASSGLSPRVRGNHLRGVTWSTGNRSIPACAGEPLTLMNGPPVTKVYPRVCGGTAM